MLSDWIDKPHTGFVLLLDHVLEGGVPVLVIDDESIGAIPAFVSVGLFLCPDLFEVRVMPLGNQSLISRFRVGYEVVGGWTNSMSGDD